MTTVSFSSVHKSFGAVDVLSDICLDIREGEFMVLVGPSGCGKSTLLRCLAGLETVTGGTVSISGRDVTRLEPRDRDIAMVFQSYALYPHRTVEGNMSFALKLAGMPDDKVREVVSSAARILGLESLLGRYPRQLSGGQRQRVAMGRAIVRDPAVFLFDEPLSNLDAALRVQMRGEIRNLQQRLGTTTVYVTHDQIEAMTMADRICVMRGGRIEQTGTPLDLFDWPANRFVAGFIGSPAMNFLPAVIENGALRVAANGSSLPLPRIRASDATQGREVLLGIRPDKIRLVQEEGILFQLTLAEPTGSETYLHGTAAGTEASFVVRERVALARDTVLRIAPDVAAMHLFDRQSGDCLTTAARDRAEPET